MLEEFDRDLLQALGDRAGDSDPLKSSSFYAVGVASCNLAMIGLAGVGAGGQPAAWVRGGE